LTIKRPVIVINFKTYPEASGISAVELALLCEAISSETGASIVVAPPMLDVALVAKSVRIPVFAQHLDPVDPGSTTGRVTIESAKASGAVGTLVNHSERRLKLAAIHDVIDRCEKVGLETIVCTNNLPVTRACAAMEPNFVAIEPPELIGGNVSVTSADPKIVSDTVEAVRTAGKGVGVLCGAGIKNGRDVAKALELGTDGVLLASGVVKAKDRRSVLRDLVSGMSR